MKKNNVANASLSETVNALGLNIINTLKEILELACLEGRLAGRSLLSILGLIIVISFLAVTVWILMMAAMTYFLITLGLSVIWSLLLMAWINLLLITLLMVCIMRLHRDLYFSKTRQQIHLSSENIVTTTKFSESP